MRRSFESLAMVARELLGEAPAARETGNDLQNAPGHRHADHIRAPRVRKARECDWWCVAQIPEDGGCRASRPACCSGQIYCGKAELIEDAGTSCEPYSVPWCR